MGNIKFLTIYDDEREEILNRNHMSIYKLAYLPVYYKVNENAFLDSINSTGRDFLNIIKNGSEISSYGISDGVFQFIYEQLSLRGYESLFVVCPHRKWFGFYKSASNAVKKFNRNAVNNNETDIMAINVLNSRAFGVAPILLANRLARMYAECSMSLNLFNLYAERFAKSSVTYVLTADNNAFDNGTELRAYRITSTRVFLLDISQSVDEEMIDTFVNHLAKIVKRHNGRFAVSYGPDCEFVSDVVVKLATEHSCFPVVETQYSIPTIKILGSKTLCVHFGEYI